MIANIVRPWAIIVFLLTLMGATIAITLQASARRHDLGIDVTRSLELIASVSETRATLAESQYRERNAAIDRSRETLGLHEGSLWQSNLAFQRLRRALRAAGQSEDPVAAVERGWAVWTEESLKVVRAGRIEELDFSKTEPPAELPRLVKSGAPELFPVRKLQAGE